MQLEKLVNDAFFSTPQSQHTHSIMVTGFICDIQPLGHDILNLISSAKVPLLVTSDVFYNSSPLQQSTIHLGDSVHVVIQVGMSLIIYTLLNFDQIQCIDPVISSNAS